MGIVAFSAQRNESRPDRLQAFARLENFGQNAAKVSAELYLDDRLVDADQIEVAPGEPQGIAFDITAVDSGVLKLKITTKDHLSLDDEAWLVLSPPRRTKVLLVTPGNEPLKMAMQTKSAREIAEVQIESPDFLKNKTYESQAAAGAYDLVIFDRCRPEQKIARQIVDAAGQHAVHRRVAAGGRVDGGAKKRCAADYRHQFGPSADAMDGHGRRVVGLPARRLKPPSGAHGADRFRCRADDGHCPARLVRGRCAGIYHSRRTSRCGWQNKKILWDQLAYAAKFSGFCKKFI